MGSGTEEHAADALDLGELLARLGVNLLSGGGRGVMESVSRAFTSSPVRSRGICIGVIPCASISQRAKPKGGYPNPFIELPIYTHLPHSGPEGTDDLSRNHINVLSSCAIVVLPGSAGTVTEAALAITYGKPVIAFSHDPGLLGNLPIEIGRVTDIAGVEKFLREYL